MWIVAEMEWRELEGKQALDEQPRQVDALDAEEAAGENNNEEGEENGRNGSEPLVEFLQEKFVSTNEYALQSAVNHEIPCGSMPQARHQEAEPEVEIFSSFGLDTAAS